MRKALRDVQIKREVEPRLGLLPSTILGALVTAAVFLLSHTAPGSFSPETSLVIPTSIVTVLIGFILLTTRYKALTQVLGYLVLENGIYLFSLLLVEAIPLVVEMGMLLDLFASVSSSSSSRTTSTAPSRRWTRASSRPSRSSPWP